MKTTTVVIQIGNTDNKLDQFEWSKFVEDVSAKTRQHAKCHFEGFSNPNSIYQNACWVLEIDPEHVQYLKNVLRSIKIDYDQDSIAFMEGETEFV